MRISVRQSEVTPGPLGAPEGDLEFGVGSLTPAGMDALGTVAVLSGDAAFDTDVLRKLATVGTDVLVLCPASETDLQAEATLEFAIKLSDSVAGLVLVVENDGAEPGLPGHGGSAIVLLGEVLAEAMGGADVIGAEIGIPVPQPVPRDPMPELPMILQQRVAHHQGRHVPVDYPSDS